MPIPPCSSSPSVIQALKSSPKGRLTYSAHLHRSPELLKPLLTPQEACVSISPKVIEHHQRNSIAKQEKEEFGESKVSNESKEEKFIDEDASGTHDETESALLPQLLSLGFDYGKSAVCIFQYEQESQKLGKIQGHKAKLEARKQWHRIHEKAEEQLKTVDHKIKKELDKAYIRAKVAAEKMHKSMVVEENKLREQNMQAIAQIKKRMEETRAERQIREEEARERAAEHARFLKEVEGLVERVQKHSSDTAAALQQCSQETQQRLSADLAPLVESIIKVCHELEMYRDRLRSAERAPPAGSRHGLSQYETKVQQAADQVLQLIETADREQREAADREAAEAAAAARTAAEEQAAASSRQEATSPASLAPTSTEGGSLGCEAQYKRLMQLLANTQKACEGILKDPQAKDLKNGLQKAINITVNSISRQSGSHVLEKLNRLTSIALGNTVEVNKARISASSHPQGKLFCTALIAKKLVKQGENQIASSADSAYPVAAVVLGLWIQVPQFGDLFLAYLFKTTPYMAPYFPSKTANMSNTEYYKLLGYTVDDNGELEPQDKFLKRVSGLTQLFSALLITPVPRGVTPQQRPLEIVDAVWRFVANLVTVPPRPGVSATLLYDVLAVAGNQFLSTYKSQAQKLLQAAADQFDSAARAGIGTDGPTSRLIGLLTGWQSSRTLPKPKGVLDAAFWQS